MRTLRILTLAVALSLTLPVFAAPAFAGSGKAILPTVQTYYLSSSNFYSNIILFSNISQNTIEITVTLHDKTGDLIYESESVSPTSGDSRATFVSSYTEATSSSDGYTMKFELDGKQSGYVVYQPRSSSGTDGVMFGTIEWKNKYSTDNDDIAMVARARHHRSYNVTTKMRESISSVAINNGLPF